MGTNTKIMLSFIGGALTGGLICFAILNEKHEEGIREVEDGLKEFYNSEIDELKEHITMIEDDEEELEENNRMYTDYVKKYNPGEVVPDEMADKAYPIEDDNYHNETPYLIDQEEFDEAFGHHDKISIIFYGDDGVLSDDDDTMIDDIDNVIGYESLDEFEKVDVNTIYVRNERLAADYEVTLVNGSYQKLILGVYDED